MKRRRQLKPDLTNQRSGPTTRHYSGVLCQQVSDRIHVNRQMQGAASKAQVAQQFFSGVSRFGVVGASADRSKYGNKVLVRT